MEILVIREYDHQDKEENNIGVASSMDNALRIIKQYYGELKLLKSDELVCGGIEAIHTYEVKSYEGEPYKVTVTVEYYTF